jgi:hypothetical protein
MPRLLLCAVISQRRGNGHAESNRGPGARTHVHALAAGPPDGRVPRLRTRGGGPRPDRGRTPGRARAPARRRGQHPAARPQDGRGPLLRLHRARRPALGSPRLRARPAVRPLHLLRRQEAAGAQGDGRNLGAHLRDLQGLPRPAGEAPPGARVLHRRRDRVLLLADRPSGIEDPGHPALLADRHGRQLQRGLVRHPHQHAGELAHGLRA